MARKQCSQSLEMQLISPFKNSCVPEVLQSSLHQISEVISQVSNHAYQNGARR